MQITRTARIPLFVIFALVISFLGARSIKAHPSSLQSQIPQSTAHRVESAKLTDPGEFEVWVNKFLAEHTSDPQTPIGLVIVKDGVVFFQKGYGQVSESGNAPVTPDQTLFRAASVSKLVTATAVMQLVEQAMIDLDTDINYYPMRFQLEDNYPSPITVRHLLTHTSGIEDRLFGNTVPSADQLLSLGDYFTVHVPRRIRPLGNRLLTQTPE